MPQTGTEMLLAQIERDASVANWERDPPDTRPHGEPIESFNGKGQFWTIVTLRCRNEQNVWLYDGCAHGKGFVIRTPWQFAERIFKIAEESCQNKKKV